MNKNTNTIDPVMIKDSVKMITKKRKNKRKGVFLTPSKYAPVNLPPIESKNTESEVKWNIKGLPTNWEPVTKPSEAIQRLMKKRKSEHESIIRGMRENMSEINSKIEEKIRYIAEIFKYALQGYKLEAKDCLKKFKIESLRDIRFSKNDFDNGIDEITSIYSCCKSKLRTMHEELRNLENIRSQVFQDILKDAYTSLSNVSYMLPFELQEYFENEIQNINEITLSNVRCYIELKAQLKLQMKNDLRLWLQEIHCAKESWFSYIKTKTFTDFNESKLINKDCKQFALKRKSSKATEVKFTIKDSNNLCVLSPHKIGTELVYKWINKVENVVFEMDECAKELVGVFRQAVVSLFDGYFDDLKQIAKHITDVGLIESSEFEELKTEICGPAVLDVTKKYSDEILNTQDLWGNMKQELQDNLQDTFLFLHRIADLWDCHLQRLNNAADMVTKDLKKLASDNNISASVEETKINIALDTLRQETDVENLNDSLIQINRSLDSLQNIYKANYEKECKLTEKLYDLIEKEGDVLYAELVQFLAAYKQSNVRFTIDDTIKEQEENILSVEIELCQNQIKTLKNWKFGLWEVIDDFSTHCKEDNSTWANNWVARECENLELILKSKLNICHINRFDRVRPIVYNIRSAELEEHNRRFERHKAGVDLETENIKYIYQKYERRYDRLVEEYNEQLTKVSKKISKAKYSAIIASNILTFKRLTEGYTEKIANVNDEYQKECDEEINKLGLASYNYAKAILLFSEGGNFSSDEAKNICGELTKLEKTYKKQIATINKVNNVKFSKCIQEIQTKQNLLQETLEKHRIEFEHYDNYNKSLKDVQANIKREVYDLKFKRKQVKAYILDIRENGEKFLGQVDAVDTFATLYDDIVRLFEELRQLLSRSEQNISVSNKLFKMESIVSTSSSKSSSLDLRLQKECKLRRKLRRTVLSGQPFQNYEYLLFEIAPIKEETFIAMVRSLIYVSFQDLQSSGKDFYSKHMNTQFLNEDKIHSNYEDFIIELLPKYIYYYLQCDMLWMEEVNEFLKLVNEFQDFLVTYSKSFINKYFEEQISEIKDCHHIISSEIEETQESNRYDFYQIYNKLKPLHGYPGNKNLLDELTGEINNFLNCKAEGFYEPIIGHKKDLDEYFEIYKRELTEMSNKLDDLINDCAEREFNNKTLLEFEETLNYLYDFLETSNSNTDLWDNFVEKKASEQLDYLKKNIDIPEEYLINIAKCVSRFSSENNPINCNCLETSESSTEVNLLIEKYSNERQDIITEIDNIEATIINTYDTWRKMWNLDVEKILKLYSVKYDPTELKS